jgi:hypothetical protein
MRERYVRGNEPITPAVIETSREAYRRAMELVRQLLAQEGVADA